MAPTYPTASSGKAFEPPARYFRSKPGWLGGSTKAGQYGGLGFKVRTSPPPGGGFFGGFVPPAPVPGTGPQPVPKIPFNPYTPRRRPFGVRGLATPLYDNPAARNLLMKYGLGMAVRGLNWLGWAMTFYDIYNWKPGQEASPPRVDWEGASCSYDCPEIEPPYSTPTFARVDASFANWSCPVPSYARCLDLQVVTDPAIDEGWFFKYPDDVPGYWTCQVAIGPGDFFDGVNWIRFKWDYVLRFNDWDKGGWVRYTPALPATLPQYVAAPDPFPQEIPNPYDPMTSPILRRGPDPVSLPYAAIPHVALPWPSAGGYGPPRTPPYFDGGLRGKPPRSIWQPPGQVPHWPEKPKPGETERKKPIPASPFGRLVKALANGITETDDAINAIFQALPDKYKFRNGHRINTIQGKAAAIVQHFDKISWSQAAKNLIANHLADKYIGKASRALTQATRNNPYWRSPAGPQAGSRYRGAPVYF